MNAAKQQEAVHFAGARATLSGAREWYRKKALALRAGRRAEAAAFGRKYVAEKGDEGALMAEEETAKGRAGRAKEAMLSAMALVGRANKAAIKAAHLSGVAKESNAKQSDVVAAVYAEKRSREINRVAQQRLRTAQWLVSQAKAEATREATLEAQHRQGMSVSSQAKAAEADRELDSASEMARVAKQLAARGEHRAAKVVNRIILLATKVKALKAAAAVQGADDKTVGAYMEAKARLKGLKVESMKLIQRASAAQLKAKLATEGLGKLQDLAAKEQYKSMRKEAKQDKTASQIAMERNKEQGDMTQMQAKLTALKAGEAGMLPAKAATSLQQRVDQLEKGEATARAEAHAAKDTAKKALDFLHAAHGGHSQHQQEEMMRAALQSSVEAGSRFQMTKMELSQAKQDLSALKMAGQKRVQNAKEGGIKGVHDARDELKRSEMAAKSSLTTATASVAQQKRQRTEAAPEQLKLKLASIMKLKLGKFDEEEASNKVRKQATADEASFSEQMAEHLKQVDSTGKMGISSSKEALVTAERSAKEMVTIAQNEVKANIAHSMSEVERLSKGMQGLEKAALAAEEQVRQLRKQKVAANTAAPERA